eukprot:gene5578-6944_t
MTIHENLTRLQECSYSGFKNKLILSQTSEFKRDQSIQSVAFLTYGGWNEGIYSNYMGSYLSEPGGVILSSHRLPIPQPTPQPNQSRRRNNCESLYVPSEVPIKNGNFIDVLGALPFKTNMYVDPSLAKCAFKLKLFISSLEANEEVSPIPPYQYSLKDRVLTLDMELETGVSQIPLTLLRKLSSSGDTLGNTTYITFTTITCKDLTLNVDKRNNFLKGLDEYKFYDVVQLNTEHSLKDITCGTDLPVLACRVYQTSNFSNYLLIASINYKYEYPIPSVNVTVTLSWGPLQSKSILYRILSDTTGGVSDLNPGVFYPSVLEFKPVLMQGMEFQTHCLTSIINPSNLFFFYYDVGKMGNYFVKTQFRNDLLSVWSTQKVFVNSQENYRSQSLVGKGEFRNDPATNLTFKDPIPPINPGYSVDPLVEHGNQVLVYIYGQSYEYSLKNSNFLGISLPDYYGLGEGESLTGSSNIVLNALPASSDDMEAPIVRSMEFYYNSQNQLIFKIVVTDNLSGFSHFTFNDDYQVYLGYQFLKSGTHMDGLYQGSIPNCFLIRTFKVWDKNENSNPYNTYEPMILQGDQSHPFKYYPGFQPLYEQFTLNSIKEIYFDPKELNVTNSSGSTTLYLKVINPVKTFKPVVEVYYSELEYLNQVFFLNFDESIGINQEFPNEFSSRTLIPIFNSTLSIISLNGDIQPPLITEINNIALTNDKMGWKLKIIDENGFNNGVLEITSNLDKTPYIERIDSSNRVSGDSYSGEYQFIFDLDSNICRDQIFTISKATLRDDSGLNFVDPDTSNPFSLSPIKQDPKLYVGSNCTPSTTIENNPPLINDFKISKSSIDVTSEFTLDRTVRVNFTVTDDTKVSTKHYPTVYIQSNGLYDLKGYQSIISDSSNSNAIKYYVDIVIPKRYGLDSILFSVYGIFDSQLNMNGYSSTKLKNSNQDYQIYVSNNPPPILESSSSVPYPQGGVITIFGRNFVCGSSLKLFVEFQNTFGLESVLDCDPHVSFSFNTSNLSSPFFKVKITSTGIPSNEISIVATTPSPSSTPEPPIPCMGTPVCSNNGQCINNTCICDNGWYGPDCKSNFNPQKPTTSVNLDEYSTIISIVSLRELNSTKGQVEFYPLDIWNLEVLTVGSKYRYTSYLNNSLNTSVTVETQFFESATNVTFAGDNISINPQSIKYSITISKYPFKASLNSLQLVMNATLVSETKDSCSIKEIGTDPDTDTLLYIKLKVNENSIFGQFFQRAVIDNRTRSVTNQYLDETLKTIDSSTANSLLGINVPPYEDSAILDPNFYMLVDQKDRSSSATCSKSGLTRAQIAGIVVGSAVAFLLLN